MQGNAASVLLDPREYWSGLDRQSRVLVVSVAVSILLHAILLTIHFRFPEAMRWKSASQPLEVVLVNSKTRDKPERAKALAQANLDGGGNTDAKRRATSAAADDQSEGSGARSGRNAAPPARAGGAAAAPARAGTRARAR